MLVTLRSFFVEMACLHGEEKGKRNKIREDQVQ